MPLGLARIFRVIPFFFLLVLIPSELAAQVAWSGILSDANGKPIAGATVKLSSASGRHEQSVQTSETGSFIFSGISAGEYELSVTTSAGTAKADLAIKIDEAGLTHQLVLAQGKLTVGSTHETTALEASGGEHLSSGEVSSLPLNERDFSKLLLLAAGTMTDTNGAANFTQQFAVNGQRGTATVFAIDGADTTDPELGGATFSNFNVDAIQEVQSSSGVMPAEIGHGAAGFTNVVTKSGAEQVHGSAFEFVRNAAFDARNYFDHNSGLDLRRIPPFARNEFGVTNGGPVVIPKVYDGRGKTYYFAEYQGFRQVLGTTQVLPVPTEAERAGIDTTTFPGDTLTVPVNPEIASILARYPLPNEPQGAYGPRTFATSSKVATRTDQFSIRIDHHFSEKTTLTGRFSLNQVNGPTTNPDQTAIDPSFGVKFFDHQRNATIRLNHIFSPRLNSTTS